MINIICIFDKYDERANKQEKILYDLKKNNIINDVIILDNLRQKNLASFYMAISQQIPQIIFLDNKNIIEKYFVFLTKQQIIEIINEIKKVKNIIDNELY